MGTIAFQRLLIAMTAVSLALTSAVVLAAPAQAATVPAKPTVSALSDNGRVIVSWNAPASNGASITKFEIASRRYTAVGWSAYVKVIVSSSTRSRSVYYPNGYRVQAMVRAYNVKGAGPWSSSVSAIVGQPDAVPGTKAVAGNAQATVSWSAAGNNGSAITAYRVYFQSYVSGAWTPWSSRATSPTARSSVFTSLVNGRAYQFYVRAENQWGRGPAGATVRVRPADTTPPGPVSALTVGVRTTSSIALSWINPTAPDLAQIVVRRNVGAIAPSTATSGTGVTLTSLKATSVTDSGLASDTTFSYSVFTKDTTGNTTTVPTPITTGTLAPDTTAPGPVTGLTVGTRSTSSITLSWTNPVDADLAQVIVRRAAGAEAPLAPSDGSGVTLASMKATGVTDAGLTSNTDFAYSVFTQDTAGNTTTMPTSITTSTLAPDTTPPGPVTNLVAGTTTTTTIPLAWTNPVDPDFAGIVIRRAAGSTAPASPTDGDAVTVTSAGATGFVDTNLAQDTTYSYALFSQDAIPNYSPAATVTGTTTAFSAPMGARIASFDSHACAITSGGAVKCWGDSRYGMLGDGGVATDTSPPVQVVGLTSGVVSVTAGEFFSCALTIDGDVKCWGDRGASGKLGDGTITAPSDVPVDVIGLPSDVVAISSGGTTTCALTSTGVVKCWGDTYGNIVGGDFNENRSTPVTKEGFNGPVASVSVGTYHACVVTSIGGAQCWGAGYSGELGSGAFEVSATPRNVVGLEAGVTSISAGANFTCAVAAGAAKCWGNNQAGKLGSGLSDVVLVTSNEPVDVIGLSSGVATVTAGWLEACARTALGAVRCWGYGLNGALGNGTTVGSDSPVPVMGLGDGSTAELAVASWAGTCAVESTQMAVCWGAIGAASAGGSVVDSTVPVDALDLT